MTLEGLIFIGQNSDLMLAEMQTITVLLKEQDCHFGLVRDVLLHSSEYSISSHRVPVL